METSNSCGTDSAILGGLRLRSRTLLEVVTFEGLDEADQVSMAMNLVEALSGFDGGNPCTAQDHLSSAPAFHVFRGVRDGPVHKSAPKRQTTRAPRCLGAGTVAQ